MEHKEDREHRELTLIVLEWSAEAEVAGRRRAHARWAATGAGEKATTAPISAAPCRFLRHGGRARRGGSDGAVGVVPGSLERRRLGGEAAARWQELVSGLGLGFRSGKNGEKEMGGEREEHAGSYAARGVRRRGRGGGHGGMVALAPCRACSYREEDGNDVFLKNPLRTFN